MLKIIFISSFLVITFMSCQKDNSVEPFNFERDTPVWLKEKIDSMSTNHEYYGTKVYRYEWNEKFTYHIMITISSCAYCELFDQSGTKIQITNDAMFSDFQRNRKNEIIIWEWKN